VLYIALYFSISQLCFLVYIDTYDAAVMSGGMALGHIMCDAFLELIRVVKPGTYISTISIGLLLEREIKTNLLFPTK